ncbi:MAG: hypothetical protein R3C56_24535 [Pirellulaceae bacterium]
MWWRLTRMWELRREQDEQHLLRAMVEHLKPARAPKFDWRTEVVRAGRAGELDPRTELAIAQSTPLGHSLEPKESSGFLATAGCS